MALLGAAPIACLDAHVGVIPGHDALGRDPGVSLLHAVAQALNLALPRPAPSLPSRWPRTSTTYPASVITALFAENGDLNNSPQIPNVRNGYTYVYPCGRFGL